MTSELKIFLKIFDAYWQIILHKYSDNLHSYQEIIREPLQLFSEAITYCPSLPSPIKKKLIAVLWYNLHSTKFSYLKYIIPCFLVIPYRFLKARWIYKPQESQKTAGPDAGRQDGPQPIGQAGLSVVRLGRQAVRPSASDERSTVLVWVFIFPLNEHPSIIFSK